jgi:hypothetical protein
MIDDCSTHCGSDFVALCREHSIIRIFIPLLSSRVLQVLDLCLCEVTKPGRVLQMRYDMDGPGTAGLSNFEPSQWLRIRLPVLFKDNVTASQR